MLAKAREPHSGRRKSAGKLVGCGYVGNALLLQNHSQVARLGTGYGRDRNASIKGRQPTVVLHGEAQEVDIGKLSVALNVLYSKTFFVTYGDGIFPKDVLASAAERR